MSKFGWHLPPGCTVAEIERVFGADVDDTVCCFCCDPLPNPETNDWAFDGFCDAKCAAQYIWLQIKAMPNVNLHANVYSDFDKALREILKPRNEEPK